VPQSTPRRATPVQIGDIVLVKLGDDIRRPLLVTHTETVTIGLRDTPTTAPTPTQQEFRVSGVLCCEPEDHVLPALRGACDRAGDPARITGRPDRQMPFAYAAWLAEGTGIGQWIPRPTHLPARS
jgi:hypothetical protein